MVSTFILVAIFAGFLLVSLLVWGFFLRVGLQWAKVPDVTFQRAILATVIASVIGGSVSLLFVFLTPSSNAQVMALGLVEIALFICIPCAVIGALFKTSVLQSIQAWLPTLVANAILVAVAVWGFRPFFYETYIIPFNGMAPTLLGQHWKTECSQCRAPCYCSPTEKRPNFRRTNLMICENFHLSKVEDLDRTVHSGDRIFVAKFFKPRRWEMAVFKSPQEPSTFYVNRLIGLPGETVVIKDGSVWIDGELQSPPISIAGIQYTSSLEGRAELEMWGTPNRSAVLANDEYFVLGDFSERSADSRIWEMGAEGHNPFAVPESHIIGVVTHTYWPPSRMRIHR